MTPTPPRRRWSYRARIRALVAIYLGLVLPMQIAAYRKAPTTNQLVGLFVLPIVFGSVALWIELTHRSRGRTGLQR